jgi:hypothetical protein
MCLDDLPKELRAQEKESRAVVSLARSGRHKIRVPANSMATFRITGIKEDYERVVIESLPEAQRPGHLFTVNTMSKVEDGVCFVRVVNMKDEDFVLQPKTIIGTIHRVDSVLTDKFCYEKGADGEQVVSLRVSVHNSSTSFESEESPASDIPVDITEFEGTDEQRQQIIRLLQKHRKAFSTGDEDLGFTNHTGESHR